MGQQAVRITVDTNILVRAFVEDDAVQAALAQRLLDRATVIAVPIPVLCEFAWVLARSYKVGFEDIADAIQTLSRIEAVVTDLPAIEAGIDMLRAGGDFADGAIALQGASLGGAVFASFDADAIALWRDRGGVAEDPVALLAVT